MAGRRPLPLFLPVRNNLNGKIDGATTTDGVYQLVRYYAGKVGVGNVEGFGVHSLRATAATNALDHEADSAQSAGVAWTCEYRHDPALRSTQVSAGG
jgi:integrase